MFSAESLEQLFCERGKQDYFEGKKVFSSDDKMKEFFFSKKRFEFSS